MTSINGPRPESGADDDITSFTYDGTSGDLLTIVRPEIGTTTFSDYNDAGLVGTVTDVNSQSTTYDYDGRGRIETITHPAASETAFTRDRGQLDRVTYPDGTYRDFEYNENNGKVDTVTDPEDKYITYTYDARGNRSGWANTVPGEEARPTSRAGSMRAERWWRSPTAATLRGEKVRKQGIELPGMPGIRLPLCGNPGRVHP